MRCPACGNVLNPITVGGITVDVCKEGCARIWFDRYELMKVDESHGSAGDELIHIEGIQTSSAPSTTPRGSRVRKPLMW
jgi:Zn-finger nucleic acid-binding protein